MVGIIKCTFLAFQLVCMARCSVVVSQSLLEDVSIESVFPTTDAITALVPFRDKLLFTTEPIDGGRQILWESDSVTNSPPRQLFAEGAFGFYKEEEDRLLFWSGVPYDGVDEGSRLMMYNGTSVETVSTDILAVSLREASYNVADWNFQETMVPFGDDLYFSARNFSDPESRAYSLWKYSRTSKTISPNALLEKHQQPQSLTVALGKLFFTDIDQPFSNSVDVPRRLYVFDGDSVINIPGLDGCNFGPFLSRVQNRLYFVCADNSAFPDRGLWSSDGTPAGTQVLQRLEIRNDVQHGILDGRLYFSASPLQVYDYELWRVVPDNVSQNDDVVELVLDTVSEDERYNSGDPRHFVPLNNHLFFVSDTSGYGSRELWSTNGSVTQRTAMQDEFSFFRLVESVATYRGLLLVSMIQLRGIWAYDSKKDFEPQLSELYTSQVSELVAYPLEATVSSSWYFVSVSGLYRLSSTHQSSATPTTSPTVRPLEEPTEIASAQPTSPFPSDAPFQPQFTATPTISTAPSPAPPTAKPSAFVSTSGGGNSDKRFASFVSACLLWTILLLLLVDS